MGTPPLPWAREAAALGLAMMTILIACSGSSHEATPAVAAVTTVPGAGPCSDATGRSVCGDGEVCGTLYVNHNPIPSCLAKCGSATGQACPAGDVCYPITGSPGRGWCRPSCTGDGDCHPGLTCRSGTCVCGSDAECGQAFGSGFACGADGFCVETCATNDDCSCDATCAGGKCASGCATDADCCAGGTCQNGRCVGDSIGKVDSPCVTSDDCVAGTVCGASFDRPRCMPVATGFCGAPGACPDGYECVGGQTSTSSLAICLPHCDPKTGGCGVAESCRPLPTKPTAGACVGACDAAHPCEAGAHCAAGQCVCDTDAACSSYGPNAKCSAGMCTCTPSCEGKTCGLDGCGGTCGTCDDTHTCAGGQCVGSCGSSKPYVSCGDGTVCPPGSTCSNSGCTCNAGSYAVECGGSACGSRCAWEYTCTACVCAAGQTCDNQGHCIAPTTSPTTGTGGSSFGGGGNTSSSSSGGAGVGFCPSGYPVNCSGGFCCPQNTVCCANKTCGRGGCPAGGTSSGGTSSSSGGAACENANGCVSTYTMSGDCKGYIGLANNCGKQVSCHWELSNGQHGCALPQPNSNNCGTNGIYAPGLSARINCEASTNFDCLDAIGCEL